MGNITTVGADAGAICINGIKFGNGVGDGIFTVYYSESLPDGFTFAFGDVWIDLRDTNIDIWKTDCADTITETITAGDLDCNAVKIARNNSGDFCLVKYF